MTQVYKYINGHSPRIMNYVFLIKRNIYNLQNFTVFENEYSELSKSML